MKLAIYTTATTGYTHALTAQARRVQAMLSACRKDRVSECLIMIVTDDEKEVRDAATLYRSLLPWAQVEVVADERFGTGFDNYKPDSQLLIGQMRTAATGLARGWDADACLSLDGDVLPPHNALRCMLDMIEFDAGYYGVAFCPYPSHGGGPFLGGHGTMQNPILPDTYEDEKVVPQELLDRRDSLRAELQIEGIAPEKLAELREQIGEVEKAIRGVPADGNVFALNGKRWRRRGWFDAAYPAIGRGAIVPVEWTGCGCTLMGREALALCDWSGYDGGGTEDLFINFRRWAQHGVRCCCIAHCPCDHVVRKANREDGYVHIMTFHETQGECADHLRQEHRPFYAHDPGERRDPKNDGRIHRQSPAAPVPKGDDAVVEAPSGKFTPVVRKRRTKK